MDDFPREARANGPRAPDARGSGALGSDDSAVDTRARAPRAPEARGSGDLGTESTAARADEALAFGRALLAEGDHYRAITELKRSLFLRPTGDDADGARFAIGLAYLRGGQPEAAATHYRALAQSLHLPALRAEALLQVGYAQYLAGAPAQSLAELSRWLRFTAPDANAAAQSRGRYLLGWTELALEHGELAARHFAALPPFPGQTALVDRARRLDHLPVKSPLVAGLLSIIPGAGHLYLGQPAIAAAAFLWNALFGFALYDAIRTRQVGLALVLGSFESLWYFGSIFGAVSGAQKLDRDLHLNALDALRATYDDRPESWPPAPPLAP